MLDSMKCSWPQNAPSSAQSLEATVVLERILCHLGIRMNRRILYREDILGKLHIPWRQNILENQDILWHLGIQWVEHILYHLDIPGGVEDPHERSTPQSQSPSHTETRSNRLSDPIRAASVEKVLNIDPMSAAQKRQELLTRASNVATSSKGVVVLVGVLHVLVGVLHVHSRPTIVFHHGRRGLRLHQCEHLPLTMCQLLQ